MGAAEGTKMDDDFVEMERVLMIYIHMHDMLFNYIDVFIVVSMFEGNVGMTT